MAVYTVTGDQFWEIVRRWRAIQEQLDRGREGKSPLDPVAVSAALQQIVEGEFPRPYFKRDMRKEAGWELVEDVREPAEIAIGDLRLATFLNHDEQYVTGDTMRERAKNIGANLGQRHAEHFLDHQEEIPESYRPYWLIFPGTVWRGRDGALLVPCLHWDGGRWLLSFDWLGHRFRSHGRVSLFRPGTRA